MISTKTEAIRFGIAALGAAMILAPAPVPAQNLPTSADRAGDALSSYLRTLAENPQSLSALMGAGRAALDLGDAQAALTFFGRAEELAPGDGRIKMWIGSALVQLEKPAAALKFFYDAGRLGVPEADIARDRGLAHDMTGNPVEAQRDYKLVLAQSPDSEVTRRMALSLAISGKKEPALAMLDDQLRRQDRAAWRARAFVLALTGDTEGANRAAQTVMPPAQAAAMAPFFARLSSLNPAERAMAVHFGRIAGDGRVPLAQAAPQPGPRGIIVAATEAGRPDGSQAVLGPPAHPASQQPSASSTSSQSTRQQVRLRGVAAAAVSRRYGPPAAVAPARSFTPTNSAPPPASVIPPSHQEQTPAAVAQIQSPRQTILPPSQAAQAAPIQTAAAGSTLQIDLPDMTSSGGPAPAVSAPQAAPVAPAAQPSSSPSPLPSGLTDIAAAIAALKDEPASPPTRRTRESAQASSQPARTRRAAAPATATAKAKPPLPASRAPARHWVQVAGGAVKSALPREYTRLKAKAPALFGNRPAWTTPLNATNRLLVGPFDSEREARAFVNALSKFDVTAFSWTSAAGQEIERLPAR